MPKSIKLLIQSIQEDNKNVFLDTIKQVRTFTARDAQDNTLLHMAVCAPQHALLMTNQLLEQGKMNVHSRNRMGETPLHLVIRRGGNVALVRLLLAYHANIFAEDAKGETPMSIVLQQQQSTIYHLFAGLNTIDFVEEQLQLKNNILGLTEVSSFIIETLNLIPHWYSQIPETLHPLLKILQQKLVDRRLLFSSITKKNKVVNETPRKLSTADKEKKASLFSKLSNKQKQIPKDGNIQLLNTTLEDLKTTLNASNETEPKVEIKAIVDRCDELLLYYQSSFTSEEKKTPPPNLRMYVEGIGYRDLSSACSKRFIHHFVPIPFASMKNYRASEFGLHEVCSMNNTHYKIQPTAPGIEHAVHALGQLFTGQASPPTELLMITPTLMSNEKPTNMSLAVLASKTVVGTVFRNLLEKNPNAINLIESYNYSLQFILALLTRPVDGKPDNFIAKAQLDNRKQLMYYELIGIDNDEAFAEPISKTERGNEHILMLKTILFCLPQVNQPIDMVLRKQILEQDASVLVVRWLKLLHQYNHNYQGYQSDILKAVSLPLRLVPKTAITLYQTLLLIQNQLRTNAILTHKELLCVCYPLVATYYNYIGETAKNDLLKATELIYRGGAFEKLLLSENEKLALNNFDQSPCAYVDNRTQAIQSAILEFIEQLDFSLLTPTLQEIILSELMAVSELSSLTLNGCQILGGPILEDMASRFTHLKHITLKNCPGLNSQGLKGLLRRFPALTITLGPAHTLEPHELLSIAQYCSNFCLILPDGSTHYVNYRKSTLLPAALKQKDMRLVTFSLLAGFHLTKETKVYSPLQEAITQKNVLLVQQLISYQSNVNQLVGKISPLDKAYELLESTPDMVEIVGSLLAAGAIECQKAEAILKIGLEILQKNLNPTLQKSLMNFALCHNQLTPELIPLLVSNQTKQLDWSRQTFAGYRLTTKLFHALFKQVPQIEEFNISGCTGFNDALLQQCLNLELKKIVIDFEQALQTNLLTDDVVMSTLQKSGLHVCINTIELNGDNVQKYFDTMLSVLKNPNNQIFCLEINKSPLSSKQIKDLTKAVKMSRNLQQVNLRGLIGSGKTSSSSTLEELDGLFQALNGHPLENVFLDSNKINEVLAKKVAQLLGDHPSIKLLSLFDNPLEDTGVIGLIPFICTHRHLESLNLNQVGLTDEGLIHLVTNGLSPSINFLDIGYNKLTTKSAQTLIELAQLNQSLTDIRYGSEPPFMTTLDETKLRETLLKNQQRQQQQQLLRQQQLLWQNQYQSCQKNSFQIPSFLTLLKGLQQNDNTLFLLIRLEMIVQEENNRRVMVENPSAYYGRRLQQFDRELEAIRRDQTALERDIMQLENSRRITLKQQDNLKQQMVFLSQHCDFLLQQKKRTLTQKKATTAFAQNKQMCSFYNTIHLKLEKLFIHYKFLSINLLKINTEQLNHVRDILHKSIEALGEPLSLFPKLNVWTVKKITAIEEERIIAQTNYIVRLGSTQLLLKIAEQTARDLTKAFHKQLKAPTITATETQLDKEIESSSGRVISRIFSALLTQQINSRSVTELVQQFISAGMQSLDSQIISPPLSFWSSSPTTTDPVHSSLGGVQNYQHLNREFGAL